MRRAGCLVVLVAALAGAQPASASHIRQVTIAARVCPSYAAITANEARNNIQESLQNLGVNTPYKPNDAMDPDVEAANQPLCSAIAGWHFILGTGISAPKLAGVWGSLSQVSGAYPTDVTTRDSTPLLSTLGVDTGRTISGAVTITLTDAQSDRASSGNLWIMGGTSAAPVGDPDRYAFGALRCGVDNLNGDNVEYISVPTPSTHAFCFAYYVSPSPKSGTIVVRKRIEVPPGSPVPQTSSVRFTGNISYTPDPKDPSNPAKNYFDVTSGLTDAATTAGQATFYRAQGQTWSFTESAVPPGTTFGNVNCTRTGGSTVTLDQVNRAASVVLTPGDVVTCTFTNIAVAPQRLVLQKVTEGGIGSFDFAVKDHATLTASTTAEGIPAAASPDLGPGTYEITEKPKPSALGTWSLEAVFCGTKEITATDPVRISVPDVGRVCTFTNKFTPRGQIRLRKVTLGATATTSFVISPEFGTPAEYLQTATTTATGVPVTATGDDTSALPLGPYRISELTPSPTGAKGVWRVDAIVCDDIPVSAARGEVGRVTLTPAHPRLDCTITDEFVRQPEPPQPQPEPGPAPPEPTVVPGPPVSPATAAGALDPSPLADLVVTKSATPGRVLVGQRVRYLVTVRNRGPAMARAVVIAERRAYNNRMLALTASKGRCRGTPPRFCVIGSLGVGQSATVRVTARTLRAGVFRNVVAAVMATRTASQRLQTAAAIVRVVPRPRPHFTG
jgi:uncharacterized protein DUF11